MEKEAESAPETAVNDLTISGSSYEATRTLAPLTAAVTYGAWDRTVSSHFNILERRVSYSTQNRGLGAFRRPPQVSHDIELAQAVPVEIVLVVLDLVVDLWMRR